MRCQGFIIAAHEVTAIHGRGLCALCYHRRYRVAHIAYFAAYHKQYRARPEYKVQRVRWNDNGTPKDQDHEPNATPGEL